jgi:hypothetical protein
MIPFPYKKNEGSKSEWRLTGENRYKDLSPPRNRHQRLRNKPYTPLSESRIQIEVPFAE